jgi:hypothetical protein
MATGNGCCKQKVALKKLVPSLVAPNDKGIANARIKTLRKELARSICRMHPQAPALTSLGTQANELVARKDMKKQSPWSTR